ncbi:MAG: DUF58 domain-containing protein [Sneathiella sp.]
MLRPSRLSNLKTDEKAEAEKLSETLPALILAAEHLANAYDLGVHGRRRTGTGEDFWQFKQYGPDDAASKIDWRQSAKREHLFIRQKEQETSESVWFWSDSSVTMDYSSTAKIGTKQFRAKVLTLALALLLTKGGEKFGLLGLSEKAMTGSTVFNTFAANLESGEAIPLKTMTKNIKLPQKATIVLISDFLTPLEDLKNTLQAFIDLGCNGIILHIADPAEVDLPFSGRTRFEGMYDEESLTFGRVEILKSDYQDVFREHKRKIFDLANSVSWECVFHRTDVSPSDALGKMYAALLVKGV